MRRVNEFEKIHAKSTMTIWIFCCCIVFALYCGMLFVEALFFGGNMHVALMTLLVSTPLVVIAFILYVKRPNLAIIPLVITTTTQLTFIFAGTYLKELDFYFFVMLLALGTSMVIKNFKLLAQCVIQMVLTHLLAAIFYFPRFDWLDHYRFFIEFLFFLYGAVFFMMLTYNVEQKENAADRAYIAFSSLLKSTPNYLVIADSQNIVRYISEPMAKFSVFSTQESAVGKPLLDLFSDPKIKQVFADILAVHGFTDSVVSFDMNGEERHFKVVADNLTGDIGGIYIDVSDITQTVNSKKIAEEAQARAEAANNSKTKFLANMSHEIRTPMNAIIGIAQIGLQTENISEEYAEALEKINNSGNILLGIINDILDLSKIETGKLELAPVPYDTPSLINDTVQINIVRIGSKEINFLIDADKSLPSKIYGDELRIKQILNNLLSNAIKYTEKGYVKLSIRHTVDPVDAPEDIMLRITVEDTGQGMKKEDLEKLFSEYQRFNVDANRATEGTGLGLSIVKRLVDMMEGTIDVQSEYGKGSAFTITVKQHAIPCEPIGEEIANRLRSFTYMGERQNLKLQINRHLMPYGKVLVVDDVETNLYVAYGLLAPYKLAIETANSGFEAIEMIEHGKAYDVIFMDHMMPYMDGIEATQKIRSLGYTGVIVALTANALTGSDKIFMENGFDGFIPKPIDLQYLDAALNEFILQRHPEEAQALSPQPREEAPIPEKNDKLLAIFRRDAEKAVATLRETQAQGDVKLFTTTVHAMKSVLANVGETETSQEAAALEAAGRIGDMEYIAAHGEPFIASLEELIASLPPPETAGGAAIVEDRAYLAEELAMIKAACEGYDDAAAYAALDRLEAKPWNAETRAVLAHIRETLYLHSDFDTAAECAAGEIAKIG